MLLKQRQAALPTGRGLACTSTCRLPVSGCGSLCPPFLCSSPGESSGTKPFPQQRGVRNVSRQAQTLQDRSWGCVLQLKKGTFSSSGLYRPQQNRGTPQFGDSAENQTAVPKPGQALPGSKGDAWLKHSLLANSSSALPPWAPTPSHRVPTAWHTQQLLTVDIREPSPRLTFWGKAPVRVQPWASLLSLEGQNLSS